MESNVLLDWGLTPSHASLAMPPYEIHESLRPRSWAWRELGRSGKMFFFAWRPKSLDWVLMLLSLPDCHSILPSSPLWLCRFCLYETKRKSRFSINAVPANFSLRMWIRPLGSLGIHGKVNVNSIGKIWGPCSLENIPLPPFTCLAKVYYRPFRKSQYCIFVRDDS